MPKDTTSKNQFGLEKVKGLLLTFVLTSDNLETYIFILTTLKTPKQYLVQLFRLSRR